MHRKRSRGLPRVLAPVETHTLDMTMTKARQLNLETLRKMKTRTTARRWMIPGWRQRILNW